ncbi:enoyl-CoA hydratase [Marinobacterium jannaschii]|uniref:enoyl-CoA hydratase n=1 Tax=Marinobacterium jannaschii TaxID=64970 RepID=UPI00048A314E|nr:enoyl-CoA hydratase [Marinobacterium jannaschii]
MSDLLLRHDLEGVATLTLNRPAAYNALSLELIQALSAELDAIATDRSVRVVVVRGAGKGFSAGHDLRQMHQSQDAAFCRQTFTRCSQMMQQIVNLPQPVIAQVHGVATAAGCQLVASCDLAVASDESRFATPGVNIGLFCSTPMVALSRTVVPKHAMEMLLLGDLVDAQRAAEIGLVNWVVASDELESYTGRLAEKVASKSRQTLTLGKAAFYRQLNQPLPEAYDQCSALMSHNMQLSDACEGIDAFLQKRAPRWSHGEE